MVLSSAIHAAFGFKDQFMLSEDNWVDPIEEQMKKTSENIAKKSLRLGGFFDQVICIIF